MVPGDETAVRAFLEAVEHPTRRADALRLDEIFRDVTGFTPQLWGTIVGYGRYHYVYDSGREGDCQATGFAPRKSNLALYIMPGYADFSEILGRLGKHKRGAACVYINKLADVDEAVVAELIRAGIKNLDGIWSVTSN